jgi:hypothetical protein
VRELGGVPHVSIGRSHVEVAADCQRPVVAQLTGEDLAQGAQPLEFVGVVRMLGLTAVRHVDRPQPHAGAGRSDRPGLRLGEARLARQPLDDLGESDARRQRHPIPATQAVDSDLVAQGLNGVVGELVVGALGLLHAHHVGADLLQPLDEAGNAGGDRVDVPGRDPHRGILPGRALPPAVEALWTCRLRRFRAAGSAGAAKGDPGFRLAAVSPPPGRSAD